MVVYRNYFFYSIIVHFLILAAIILNFSKVSIGNNKNKIIQASLYSADFVAKQIPMTSSVKKTEYQQKKTVSHDGIYKVKPQIVKSHPSQRQHQRLLEKKLTIGDQNTLLQMIHDAIAKRQQYPQQAAFLNETGNVTVRFILQPSGEINAVRIVQSSGFAILDAAALSTMQQISPIRLVHQYLVNSKAFTIKIHFD